MYLKELVNHEDDFSSWCDQVTDAVHVILADTGTDVDYEVIIDRLKNNNLISQVMSTDESMDLEDLIDEIIDELDDM